jgi:hypothetical protein
VAEFKKSEAFSKILAAKQKKDAASTNSATLPVPQNQKAKAMPMTTNFPEGTAFYRTSTPSLNIMCPLRVSRKRERISFIRNVYHTDDVAIQQFLAREFVRGKKLVEQISQDEYLGMLMTNTIKPKNKKTVIVDEATEQPDGDSDEKQQKNLEVGQQTNNTTDTPPASTVVTGQSSSTNVVAPAASVAGQK